MKRIIWHWTAGGNRASEIDRKHYHFMFEGDGNEVKGIHPVEANESPVRGQYAAHTRNCNTGSIGIAACGMYGAKERPFQSGEYPITSMSIGAMVRKTADLCEEYSIEVRRDTVLSHAEVQRTLGVRQRGKWDISWLPGMTATIDPVDVGDELRAGVREELWRRTSKRSWSEEPAEEAADNLTKGIGAVAGVGLIGAAIASVWDKIAAFFGGLF